MRLRALRVAGLGALGLALSLSSAPGSAQSSPTAWTDAARSDLIARVARSVVHVKSVGETPPPLPPPATSKSSRSRNKPSAGLEDFLRTFGGRDPREPRREEGTGFVFDAGRGLVLTAAHIVDRAKSVSVVLPGGSERGAEILGIDSEHGIAVLRVPGMTLPSLPLATRRPRAGETSLVVGWMIPAQSVLATQGMVMGALANDKLFGASVPDSANYHALDNLLPNGGFGGSPAVDTAGNVIGLVSAIYSRDGFSQQAVTLVIAVDRMRPIIEKLIAGPPKASAPDASSP